MNNKLTGRTRHRMARVREGVFKSSVLLVLQVEEVVQVWESLGQSIDCHDVVRWRDARVEDLTELEDRK